VLGHFGEIHPRVLAALDVAGPLVAFEAFLDTIPNPKAKPSRTRSRLQMSEFQTVARDFAFVVDAAVPAGVLVQAARGADKALISGATVFDVYEAGGEAAVPVGKKSIAITVEIAPTERTLTDAEIQAISHKIVAAVTKTTGGTLRS
jgi:phenylalanyl-tRNA synthetase beta chain